MPPVDVCPTLPACAAAVNDYNCRVKPQLQCEANRTCHFQVGGYECRKPDGNCESVLTIVVPNNRLCSILHLPLDELRAQ